MHLERSSKDRTWAEKFFRTRQLQRIHRYFEDLHGIVQLPGIAAQRLMMRSYGLRRRWLETAALVRAMKQWERIAGCNSFMEDYTYHFDRIINWVLGAHMLEIANLLPMQTILRNTSLWALAVKPTPVRLVFNSGAGLALNASMNGYGQSFSVIGNEVYAVAPVESLPKLPVALFMRPYPDRNRLYCMDSCRWCTSYLSIARICSARMSRRFCSMAWNWICINMERIQYYQFKMNYAGMKCITSWKVKGRGIGYGFSHALYHHTLCLIP